MATFSRVKRKVFRYWFYFRIGYAYYLVYPLGIGTTIVTVYYLFIRAIPSLENIFPNFWVFAFLSFVVGAPLACLFGLFHFKRSRAYSSEQDIGAESNPYNFKLPPGYNRTVYMPFFLEMLFQLKKIRESQGGLSSDEKSRIENLEVMLQRLQRGETVK